jgi:DNA repair exonuclease SbcCD ATPase subunit
MTDEGSTTEIVEKVEEKEFIEPGTLEGTRGKVDPRTAQDALTPDHPRFRDIYRQMKDFERKFEKAEKDKSEFKLIIDGMKTHNQRLAEAIESGVSRIADSQVVNIEQNEMKNLEDSLKQLKGERTQALKDADYDAVEDISDRIDTIKDRIREVKSRLAKREEDDSKKRGFAAEPDPQEIATVNSWIAEVDWYNEDPIMRASAIQLDLILFNDPKWQEKGTKARLAEVKSRIERRFNYTKPTGGAGTGRASAANVDTSLTGGAGGTNLSTSLSPDELEVAKGLGLSPEQYLKQKQLIARGI